MFKHAVSILCGVVLAALAGCSTAYKAQPLPFKTPEAYNNSVQVGNTWIGGEAFADPERAKAAFGFDIRGAGMLPVQLVFDNQGSQTLEINPSQTFLIDNEGNLWPILTDRFAYERATRYAQTHEIFKEGAYAGFMGAAAGSLIGAAIGIVSGENVGTAIGQGAAVGGAAGAVLGGAKGAVGDEARSAIVRDLKDKSLQNKAILPGNLAHGIIFFPGEATSARQLRLQLIEPDSGTTYTLTLPFQATP
jgi:hypothetical protein